MGNFLSVITEGIKKSKSINNEIDLRLPRALWGIEDFSGEKTSLTDLYNKKIEITRIENKIELENRVLESKLKEIKSNYSRDLDIITTDLIKERDIKKNYFEEHLAYIQTARVNSITQAKQEFADEKNRRIMEKESEYKKTLQNYHSLIEECVDLFKRYGKDIDLGNTGKVSEDKIKNISYGQLELAVNVTKNRILNILENSIVVDKEFKKIESMDKGEVKKVGSAAIVTSLINPLIPIIGTGLVVGTSIIGTYRAKERVQKELENLLYIYIICKKKYDIAYKDNKIDVGGLDVIRDNKIKEAKENYEMSIKQLEDERNTWAEDYKERCKKDYTKEFIKKTDEEMSKLSEVTRTIVSKYNEKLNQLKEEYKVLEKDLRIRNTKKPIVDIGNEEIFARLKKAKGMVDDFNMYDILKSLKYKDDDYLKDKDDLETKAQIEYDKELKNGTLEKLKEKLEPLKKEGKDKDYWIYQRKEISKEEDIYYLANTDRLHLGKLNQQEKFGILSENQEVFSENWNNNSILVFYNNDVEEDILVNYVKYLALQVVGKTGPENITLNIVNPAMDIKFNDILLSPTKTNEQGQVEKLADIIVNQSGDSLRDFRDYTEKYIKRLVDNDLSGGKTFHSLVKEKRARESKCPKMVLNILHRSGPEDPLINLNEISSTTGVVNICLLRNDLLKQKELDNGVKVDYIEDGIKYKLSKTPIMMYINKNTDCKILNIVNKNGKYVQILLENNYMDPNSVIKDLNERYLRSTKNKTFTLIDEYIGHIIPEGEMWKGDASTSVMLNFGYVDGDKSKPYPIILDETSNVHMMLCGTTGGGKSVSLDTMVDVLKMRYAPSQLDVFYYDFKRVGVATHAKPYKWPNASAMSASENGDYIISILKELVRIQNERYAMADSLGVSKLSEIQRELKKKKKELIDAGKWELASKIEIPARMLVIIDEFQSAFDINDDVSAEVKFAIRELATKARAAGIHMIIVTQDPANTKVPESVFNLFTIRVCTKATKSVSQSVLKNDFASRPENQFVGFLGANITGGTEEGNRQYVVPFTKPEMNKLYSKITSDRANDPDTPKEDRSRDAIWFSDDNKVNYKDLDNYVEGYYKSPGQFVLGKKIEYQKVDVPYVMELYKDTAQNISFISAVKEFKVEFYKTIMKSIAKDKDAEVLTLFSKEYDPAYDTENLTKNTMINWTYFINKDTGKRCNQTFLEGITQEEIDKGKWIPKDGPIKYMDDSYYTPMVTSINDTHADESLNSLFTQILQAQVDSAREDKRNGILPSRKYLILIEPERDQYIMPERLWTGREFSQMLNEGASYGVHTIVITSKSYRMADLDIFGWKIGKSVGEEASSEKMYRGLEKGVTKVNDMVDISKSRKILMPTEQKDKKFVWE